MQRSKIKDIFAQEQAGGDVLVQGWVKTRRSSKAVTFVQITDGSTLPVSYTHLTLPTKA